jgi:threonine dehydrogenase-like Zn-dependent dehydrogenase
VLITTVVQVAGVDWPATAAAIGGGLVGLAGIAATVWQSAKRIKAEDDRANRAEQRAAEADRANRRLEAYDAVVAAAELLLRNRQQTSFAYRVSDWDHDPHVKVIIDRADRLSDDLRLAVVRVQIVGSDAARAAVRPITVAAVQSGDLYTAHLVALAAQGRVRTSGTAPQIDDAAVDASHAAFAAAIEAFIDAVRPEIAALPAGGPTPAVPAPTVEPP